MTKRKTKLDVWLEEVVVREIVDWVREVADLDDLAAMWSDFQRGKVVQVHDRFGTASSSYRNGTAWKESK